MIGNIDNPDHRHLIEDFERRHPDSFVHVTTMFVGFAGSNPTRRQVVSVHNKTTGQSIDFQQNSVVKTLLIAELGIPEKTGDSQRQQYDSEVVTRYLPSDLKELGWRCRGLWSELEPSSIRRVFHMHLSNAEHERAFDTWDDILGMFDYLIEEARKITRPGDES